MATRNRLVTLERQLTPGTDWNRGTRGSSPTCSLREKTPTDKLQTPIIEDTPRVFRKGEDERLTWTDFMESTRPAQSTTNSAPGTVTCHCGKVCKNQRGLRIHQGKSGCQRVRPLEQRIASMASETQEYSSQETTHSTDELTAQETAHDATQDPVMDEDDPLLE